MSNSNIEKPWGTASYADDQSHETPETNGIGGDSAAGNPEDTEVEQVEGEK